MKNKIPARVWEVWNWPEFQAFARRLGIDLDAHSQELTIHFPRRTEKSMSPYVSVTYVFNGTDKAAGSSVIIDADDFDKTTMPVETPQ